MTKKAYLQQDDIFMKLTMARANTLHERINYNNLGKIEYHVNNLPGIFYSKSRARLRHARSPHNCKQGHGCIDHNYIYKTSLLTILKISMDLTVATWIHGNKITAVTDWKSQVPENRNITKPSLHACASHHIDHKNTWHTPLQRWHGIDQNTCRAHAHKMHTSIATKITEHQVLISNSSKHHIAFLH